MPIMRPREVRSSSLLTFQRILCGAVGETGLVVVVVVVVEDMGHPFVQSFGFFAEQDGAAGFFEEEDDEDHHHAAGDDLEVEDPAPGRVLCDYAADYRS
jgi:hypothetical protein